jgi:hypothetical protein
MSVMTEEDFVALRAYVSARYARSGMPEHVLRALSGHNDRVLGYVDALAAGEGLGQDEYELFKTVAILHDAAKAETPLMLHAEAGSEMARAKLGELGKPEAFVDEVAQAVRCHLGPFPFVEEEANKYAERTGEHLHLPRPKTPLEKLFYDADMLALIDVEGIEKVAVLRATTPEFIAEDERTSAERGITQRAAAYESALQSVRRAVASLFSDAARGLAAGLVAEAERHVATQLSAEAAAS